jgi:membrane protease subunit (stomatin/prohibitin family)
MKVASDKVLLDFSKMKQDIYFVSLYDVDGSKFTCKVIKK